MNWTRTRRSSDPCAWLHHPTHEHPRPCPDRRCMSATLDRGTQRSGAGVASCRGLLAAVSCSRRRVIAQALADLPHGTSRIWSPQGASSVRTGRGPRDCSWATPRSRSTSRGCPRWKGSSSTSRLWPKASERATRSDTLMSQSSLTLDANLPHRHVAAGEPEGQAVGRLRRGAKALVGRSSGPPSSGSACLWGMGPTGLPSTDLGSFSLATNH